MEIHRAELRANQAEGQGGGQGALFEDGCNIHDVFLFWLTFLNAPDKLRDGWATCCKRLNKNITNKSSSYSQRGQKNGRGKRTAEGFILL
jgi:hypothetical protein